MNAVAPLRPTSLDWDCVTGDFWIAEPHKTFPEGCGIVLDALTGKQWGIGKTALGVTARVPLYVPLCGGCDNPLDGQLCHDCQIIHTDIPA